MENVSVKSEGYEKIIFRHRFCSLFLFWVSIGSPTAPQSFFRLNGGPRRRTNFPSYGILKKTVLYSLLNLFTLLYSLLALFLFENYQPLNFLYRDINLYGIIWYRIKLPFCTNFHVASLMCCLIRYLSFFRFTLLYSFLAYMYYALPHFIMHKHGAIFSQLIVLDICFIEIYNYNTSFQLLYER